MRSKTWKGSRRKHGFAPSTSAHSSNNNDRTAATNTAGTWDAPAEPTPDRSEISHGTTFSTSTNDPYGQWRPNGPMHGYCGHHVREHGRTHLHNKGRQCGSTPLLRGHNAGCRRRRTQRLKRQSRAKIASKSTGDQGARPARRNSATKQQQPACTFQLYAGERNCEFRSINVMITGTIAADIKHFITQRKRNGATGGDYKCGRTQNRQAANTRRNTVQDATHEPPTTAKWRRPTRRQTLVRTTGQQ